jgi:hypothetical protein
VNFGVVSWPDAALFFVAFLSLLLLICSPIFRKYDDDKGDGRAIVLIPAVVPPRWWRTFVFLGVFSSISLLYVALGIRPLDTLYGEWTAYVASLVVHDPIGISYNISTPHLGSRFLIVAYFLSLPLAAQAGPLRRFIIAFHAVWYVVFMLMADAGLVMLGVVTGWPVQPFGLQGNVFANVLGLLVFARLTFLDFALPRATTVPREKRSLAQSAIWGWPSSLQWPSSQLYPCSDSNGHPRGYSFWYWR